MSHDYHCGCGEWTGEACNWSGPASEMVVVEYMPPWLRASHEAAGNSGVYPHNGAVRVAVERSCADCAIKYDPDWKAIVNGADPAKYADDAE